MHVEMYPLNGGWFAKIMLSEKEKNMRDQQRVFQPHILNARLLFYDKNAFCGGDGVGGWQESHEDTSMALIP